MIESNHLSNIFSNKPEYNSQWRKKKKKTSSFQSLFSTRQPLIILNWQRLQMNNWVTFSTQCGSELPRKGAIVCISLSICCQHKARFEVKHQSQRRVWAAALVILRMSGSLSTCKLYQITLDKPPSFFLEVLMWLFFFNDGCERLPIGRIEALWGITVILFRH